MTYHNWRDSQHWQRNLQNHTWNAIKIIWTQHLPYNIHKKVLKHCLPSIAKIVNLSLVTEEFCDKWKSAVGQPLIKVLSKGTVNQNYRPVSNLPFISKILEKCTLNQLTKHCDTHNLLPKYQSAYRKFHSCETSLLKIVIDTLWAMEN